MIRMKARLVCSWWWNA